MLPKSVILDHCLDSKFRTVAENLQQELESFQPMRKGEFAIHPTAQCKQNEELNVYELRASIYCL
jgi:hypothetical protein